MFDWYVTAPMWQVWFVWILMIGIFSIAVVNIWKSDNEIDEQ